MRKATMIFFIIATFALSLPVFFVEIASAHYLWVGQDGDVYFIARGGLPDKIEAYNPAAVVLIKAVDSDGIEIPIQRRDAQDRAVFKAERQVSLAGVVAEWGSRVNTTKGKRLLTRKEAEAQGLKVLHAFTSSQTSKTLFKHSASVSKPLGLRFEIVPERSPFSLKPGEDLKIKVLFDGAPLKDSAVTSGQNAKTVTDNEGKATVGVSTEGLNVIMAQYRIATPDDPDYNFKQFMTFFVFKVR